MLFSILVWGLVIGLIHFVFAGVAYGSPRIAKMYREAEKTEPGVRKWPSRKEYVKTQFLGTQVEVFILATCFFWLRPLIGFPGILGAALLGAADLLGRRAIRCLFVELAEWAANRAGHSTRDIKQLLYSSRYRLYELDSGRLAEVRPETIHHGQNIIALAPGFEVHAF